MPAAKITQILDHSREFYVQQNIAMDQKRWQYIASENEYIHAHIHILSIHNILSEFGFGAHIQCTQI